MDNIEEKLGAILNNPQMMQQIMSMASALGTSQSPPPPQEDQPMNMPEIDFGMLQKLSGLASQTGIDSDQQKLLHALSPYLSRERIGRLERAMRAARTARIATDLLGSGGLSFLTGR